METFSVQVAHDRSAEALARLPAGVLRPALPMKTVPTLAHRWRIGKGSAFRGDLVAGERFAALTTPLPKWSVGEMTLPTGTSSAKHGLVSSIMEADDEAWLIALRFPADLSAGTTLILGNMTSNSADGGWGLFFGTSLLKVSTFGLTTVTQTITLPTGYIAGGLLAVGVAHTASSRIAQCLGGAAVTTSGGARLKSATRGVAIGEPYYTAALARYPVKIAAVEHHVGALDAAALAAALSVFAEDCAAQGVPVYGG